MISGTPGYFLRRLLIIFENDRTAPVGKPFLLVSPARCVAKNALKRKDDPSITMHSGFMSSPALLSLVSLPHALFRGLKALPHRSPPAFPG